MLEKYVMHSYTGRVGAKSKTYRIKSNMKIANIFLVTRSDKVELISNVNQLETFIISLLQNLF